MAFQDLVAELRGCVPKLPYAYSKTLVNRAWKTVRESGLWSFNLFTSAWATSRRNGSTRSSAPHGSAGTATINAVTLRCSKIC